VWFTKSIIKANDAQLWRDFEGVLAADSVEADQRSVLIAITIPGSI
jgi:hypothetical protein